jgi:phosphatidylglycerol:prolipoprotein diacylglycerol transferase
VYPRLFQFGPITLPTYGACLALGLVAALFLALHNARRLKIPPEAMWNLSMAMVLSGLVGSKLLLILTNLRDFFRFPLLMLSLPITQSPRALFGGAFAALVVGYIYLRAKKMPLLATLDALTPAFLLADAFANLGAFASGSNYGLPTAHRWGVTYTSHLAAFWSGTPLGVRLHPTQLYLCAADVLIWVLVLWLLPRQRQTGECIGSGLFLYGLALFSIDFFRGDLSTPLFHGTLSLSQCIAVWMVIVGAMLWLEREAPAVAASSAPALAVIHTSSHSASEPPPQPSPPRPRLHLIEKPSSPAPPNDAHRNRQEK